MLLGNPLGNLAGAPGAGPLGDFSPDGLEHGRGHIRGVTAARFVAQGIKAVGDEGFDPGADSVFVCAEMESNLGHAPASIGEANHFKAVTKGRSDARLSGTVSQFWSLVVS